MCVWEFLSSVSDQCMRFGLKTEAGNVDVGECDCNLLI